MRLEKRQKKWLFWYLVFDSYYTFRTFVFSAFLFLQCYFDSNMKAIVILTVSLLLASLMMETVLASAICGNRRKREANAEPGGM